MIIIKDEALKDYEIHEDFQGIRVVNTVEKINYKAQSLNDALMFIADRLFKSETKTYTLEEYTQRKEEIRNAITNAQTIKNILQ